MMRYYQMTELLYITNINSNKVCHLFYIKILKQSYILSAYLQSIFTYSPFHIKWLFLFPHQQFQLNYPTKQLLRG